MVLSPEDIVFNFGLMPGQHVADFGAGSGHIVEALAEALGREGLAIAVDINPTSLLRIKKIKEEKGLNIETVLGDLEEVNGSHLVPGAVHGVVISHTLSQVRDRKSVLNEAKRILKNGGALYIVEDEKKVREDSIVNLAEGCGFRNFSRFQVGENNYGLILKK